MRFNDIYWMLNSPFFMAINRYMAQGYFMVSHTRLNLTFHVIGEVWLGLSLILSEIPSFFSSSRCFRLSLLLYSCELAFFYFLLVYLANFRACRDIPTEDCWQFSFNTVTVLFNASVASTCFAKVKLIQCDN